MELCWNSDRSISFVESTKVFYSPRSQSISNVPIENNLNYLECVYLTSTWIICR